MYFEAAQEFHRGSHGDLQRAEVTIEQALGVGDRRLTIEMITSQLDMKK